MTRRQTLASDEETEEPKQEQEQKIITQARLPQEIKDLTMQSNEEPEEPVEVEDSIKNDPIKLRLRIKDHIQEKNVLRRRNKKLEEGDKNRFLWHEREIERLRKELREVKEGKGYDKLEDEISTLKHEKGKLEDEIKKLKSETIVQLELEIKELKKEGNNGGKELEE